jgi:nicotinamidase-related amidase
MNLKGIKMATVRKGQNTALMVVDVQQGVMKNAWEAESVIANVAAAVAQARASNMPVIWVQHADAELVKDTAEWQWVAQLTPASGEALVHKQFNSAFEGTELESQLAALDVAHIVLCGAATNWCIRATAYAALERGYDLTLIEDAHSTVDMPVSSELTIPAANIVAELNTTLRWLSYPGRRNAVQSVDEFFRNDHSPQ